MKTRTLMTALTAMLFISCGGDAEEAPAAAEMTDEEQLVELREGWAQHYNMHHASVVAGYYTDEVVTLNADGAVVMGREDNTASLETQMAGSPNISLTGEEMMVFDGLAVALGSYSVETTPEGADPMTITGAYLTSFTKESGDWKINLVVTNYDSPRPEGWAYVVGDGEDAPEDEGTMTDMLGGLATHFNMGHASVAAGYYTDDAITSSGDSPITVGREAVTAYLEEFLAESPGAHLTIHDVATIPLAEGWALDGGWFQVDASEGGDPLAVGSFLLLCKQAEDGSWQIHWEVGNMQPLAD